MRIVMDAISTQPLRDTRPIKARATTALRKRSEYGQVLPLWAASVVLCFALMFLVLNYGNQIRYQIRAQNAADSAAAAIVGLQAERFNTQMEMLYAMNVEEYRAVQLTLALNMTINQSGGCKMDPSNYASVAFGTCGYVYAKLHDPMIRASNRYSADVIALEQFSRQATFANWQQDGVALLGHLHRFCNSAGQSLATYHPDGGDCAFQYSVAPNGIVGRTGVHATYEDAESILVPSLGRTAPIADDSQAMLWTPGKVDVVACALIPAIVPNFGPFKFQPTYAVGRGAATAVMVEQDWLQPGSLTDPARSSGSANDKKFQPIEDYVDNVPNHDFSQCTSFGPNCMQAVGYPDYYNVNFGGNPSTASTSGNYYSAPVNGPEMSVRTGWWGSLPIRPFGGAPTLTDAAVCK